MERTSSIRDFATRYTRRGWSVIPVPYRSKNPDRPGWERWQLSEPDISRRFGRRCNVGVLMGEPSRWLVDVDLDHMLAVKLAKAYLPTTGAVFGRAGKRRSHWLYYVSQPVATKQWRLPDRKMVVELRSTGGQTVFPGSVHPNGELIEWDINAEPALVAPNILVAGLQAIHDQVCHQLGIEAEAPLAYSKPPRVSAAPPSILRRAYSYLAKLPPAVSGQGGHGATFRAACVLVIGFGLDREQALALLEEWNERCQPPWSQKELEHKVDDAMRQPGWRGHLISQDRSQITTPARQAIVRANRHAIEHRRRTRRRAHA